MSTLVIAVDGAGDLDLDAQIGQHFGGAESFLVAQIDENGSIQSHRVVNNPHFGAHKPGAVPAFVARDLAADALIVGGIGQRAVAVLGKHQIEVCAGFTGTIREGIGAYLRGERGGAPGCGHHEHAHGDGCGGHNHGHGCDH